MSTRLSRSALLLASAIGLSVVGSQAAMAQASSAQLTSIEKQIQSLQAELRRMKSEAASRDRQLRQAQQQRAYTPPVTQAPPVLPQIPAGYALVPAAPGSAPGSVVLARAEPPPPPLPAGTFQVGNVQVKLGGFIDATSLFRSRNIVTDISTPWNNIPLNNSVTAHETEFHETARQSRISGVAEADPDEVTKVHANITVDFQGGAPTSNYNQANGWTPRLREAWADYERSDWGFEVLGGQTWSLLVPNKTGVDPLNVVLPTVVDANYVVGFNYTRQAGLRIAKSFGGGQYWLAASIENSSTLYSQTAIPAGEGTLNVSNAGVGLDGTGSNATTSVVSAVTTTGGKTTTTTTTVLTPGNITDDIAPDVLVKATADYNIAHFEAFGLGRVFHTRLSDDGTGQSRTQFGGGGGADAYFHIIPKKLDFSVSGMAGQGIGRYEVSQLPDATIGRNGAPVAIPQWNALVGLIGHPSPAVDVYGYLGTTQTSRRSYTALSNGKLAAFGYGNPLYDNAGCEVELAAASTCVANTSGITEGTVGLWYKFLHGSYGTMEIGPNYAFIHRSIFQGVGKTPDANENAFYLSFRYFPFQ